MTSGVGYLVCEALLAYAVVLGVHTLRHRWSLAPTYAALGTYTALMVWTTDTGIHVEAGGFTILVGSGVFFVAVLLGVFVLYVFDGPRSARIGIACALGATVVAPAAAFALKAHGLLQGAGFTEFVPYSAVRLYVASSGALLADFLFIAVLWQFMNNEWRFLPLTLRVLLSLLGALWLDALVFVTGAFAGDELYWGILSGHIVTRAGVAFVASPLVAVYFRREQRVLGAEPERRPLLAILHPSSRAERDLSTARREIERRKRAEIDLRGRDAILEAVGHAAERFLEARNWEANAQDVLARLGNAAHVSRVYVFQHVEDESGVRCMSHRFEWTAPGIEPQLENPTLQRLPYATGPFGRWDPLLQRGDVVHGHVRDLPSVERQALSGLGILSVAVVPVFVDAECWGFIGFDDSTREHTWSPAEIDALRAAAGTVGAAIQRARTEGALEAARLNELEIGSRIEEILLHGRLARSVRGAAVAALSVPSQHLDGDFYDLQPHGATCFDVLVGDVMGKGILAALIGAGTKHHVLRSLSGLMTASRQGTPPAPAAIVTEVDAEVTPRLMALERFLTLCYARIDLMSRTVTIVDCGHTRTVHFRAGTGRTEFIQGNSLPLGFIEDQTYEQVSRTIEEGDVLLFYSDGVTEAANLDRVPFGQERLAALVQAHAHTYPHELLRRIQQSVLEFAESEELADDFTCIAVAVLPEGHVTGDLQVSSNLAELRRVRTFVESLVRGEGAKESALGDEVLAQIELAVHEAVANVIEHVHHENPDEPILVTGHLSADELAFGIHYAGPVFDPASAPAPELDSADPAAHRDRGRGVFIIREVFDEYRCTETSPGQVCVSLVKNLDAATPPA
ncbi:MAG: SpoIIE family protein phosphatase [bacterium]|nr:SpoIIE family protein phosphatase [bacterium]